MEMVCFRGKKSTKSAKKVLKYSKVTKIPNSLMNYASSLLIIYLEHVVLITNVLLDIMLNKLLQYFKKMKNNLEERIMKKELNSQKFQDTN